MKELQPIDHPDYRCRLDGWYHDYSNHIAEDESLVVEGCIRCGHTIRFVKDKDTGRIDTKRYGETHELFFLQPDHPFFKRYYPDYQAPPPKNKWAKMSFEERKEQLKEDIGKEASKAIKTTYTTHSKKGKAIYQRDF